MKIENVADSEHFKAWKQYHGNLITDCGDERFPVSVYGFDACEGHRLSLEPVGAVFGFVHTGRLVVSDPESKLPNRFVRAGEYFCTRNGARVMSDDGHTRAVLIQRKGWRAYPHVGGPVEEKGRLKYIDGCSDSLLISPPVKGDACLNLLHFPEGIDQTQHTHPSIRVGMVHRGGGHCTTPHGRFRLEPGLLFVIPKDGEHRFDTLGETHMDVVAFHPDTDFGPDHEVHPMVNRTLVGGAKIDNSQGVHATADTENGYFTIKR